MDAKPFVLGLGLGLAAIGGGWMLRDAFTPAAASAPQPAPQRAAQKETPSTNSDPDMARRLALLDEAATALASAPQGVSAWTIRFNPFVPGQLKTDLAAPMQDGSLTAAEMLTTLGHIGNGFADHAAPALVAASAEILRRHDIADPEGRIAGGLVKYFLHYRQEMPLPSEAVLDTLRTAAAPAEAPRP